MQLEPKILTGRHVALEPFRPDLKEEVRAAIDCDHETWRILPINATGDRFEAFFEGACNASLDERLVYAIRHLAEHRIVGMSTFYLYSASQGGVEIGTTFLHPDVRSGVVNPEAKLLMMDHAFDSGAVRVQFRVDVRNKRSQAAVTKLGARKEGVLRKDRMTWTGHIRDTVYFSVIKDEWPDVKARLKERVADVG